MELLSDNIEELSTVLNSNTSHPGNVFRTKSNLSTLDVDVDVDRVISEAQDSLLNTSLEAIRSCDVPCSFNDILDDICKMNNRIELQQAAVNTSTPQPPLETPTFYHMPDLEMQPEDYTSECNFSNQTDFLQPLGQWSEYLPLPPSALSTIQDIPQLVPIDTTIPSPPPMSLVTPQITCPRDVPSVNVYPNIAEKKTDSSVPMVPLQFFNNYEITIPTATEIGNYHSTQHNEIPITQTPDGNINFMMPSVPSPGAPFKHVIQQQPPFFDWARVVPRRAYMQPSEIVVLRPLRTRKVMSSRSGFDLASYFDTSTISIPMIRERPRSRIYRRKQKLYTIPGADNLVFGIPVDPSENKGDKNNNEEQLYPETEIPELDEIFKRKRRTLHNRRNPAHQDRIKSPTPPSPPQPVEVSKEVENMSPSSNTYLESQSDVESDDAPLHTVKSMKCSYCRKLFKTCRSLTIHSKRCKISRRTPDQELPKPPSSTSYSVSMHSSKENIDFKKQDKAEIVATRPLTRSQTKNALKRKSTGATGGGLQKHSK